MTIKQAKTTIAKVAKDIAHLDRHELGARVNAKIAEADEARQYLHRADAITNDVQANLDTIYDWWELATGVEWTPDAFAQLEWTEVAFRDDEIVGVLARDLERGEVRLDHNGYAGGYYAVEEDKNFAMGYRAAWIGKVGVVAEPYRANIDDAIRDVYRLYHTHTTDGGCTDTLPIARPDVATADC